MILEKERIEALLNTLERTLKTMRGEDSMSQREKFKGFDFSYNPYEEEARQLWGDETVEKSNDFIASKSDRESNDMEKTLDELFRGLAEIRDEDPDLARAPRKQSRRCIIRSTKALDITTPLSRLPRWDRCT